MYQVLNVVLDRDSTNENNLLTLSSMATLWKAVPSVPFDCFAMHAMVLSASVADCGWVCATKTDVLTDVHPHDSCLPVACKD